MDSTISRLDSFEPAEEHPHSLADFRASLPQEIKADMAAQGYPQDKDLEQISSEFSKKLALEIWRFINYRGAWNEMVNVERIMSRCPDVLYIARVTGIAEGTDIALKRFAARPGIEDNFKIGAEAASMMLEAKKDGAQIPQLYEEYTMLPFLGVEFIPGETFEKLIDMRNLLAPRLKLEMCAASSRCIESIVKARKSHADIKPGNMVARSWKLPDYDGKVEMYIPSDKIVYAIDCDFMQAVSVFGTKLGGDKAMGTPIYMAPEVARFGYRPTDKTDVFALGGALYELLTGDPVFEYEHMTPMQIMACNHTYGPDFMKLDAVQQGLGLTAPESQEILALLKATRLEYFSRISAFDLRKGFEGIVGKYS